MMKELTDKYQPSHISFFSHLALFFEFQVMKSVKYVIYHVNSSVMLKKEEEKLII